MTKLKITTLLTCGSLMLGAAYASQSTTTSTSATTPPTTTPTTMPTDNSSANGLNTNDTSTSTTTTATAPMSDDAIQSAVQNNLSSFGSKIKVAVSNGVANLSGQLDTDSDYDRAVTMAQSTDGVSDVTADNLTVKNSQAPLTDTLITAKVKGSLLKSKLLGSDIPSWSVSVETKNGEVFLSGTVSSDDQKQNILNIVRSVNGVSKVNDQMTVSSNSTDNNANTNNANTSNTNNNNSSDGNNDTSGDNSNDDNE